MPKDNEMPIVIATKQTEHGAEPFVSEVTVNATVSEKEGVKIITYVLEDSLNVLMVYNGFAKMVKQGEAEAEMLFKENAETTAVFSLAGNKLTFDVFTRICKTGEADNILELEYTLSAGGQLISEYELNIRNAN